MPSSLPVLQLDMYASEHNSVLDIISDESLGQKAIRCEAFRASGVAGILILSPADGIWVC